MEIKNFSQKDLNVLNEKLNYLLKNPKKNFYEINNIYQKLLIIYFLIKKQFKNHI